MVFRFILSPRKAKGTPLLGHKEKRNVYNRFRKIAQSFEKQTDEAILKMVI